MWGLDWIQSLKQRWSKSVRALLFSIHVKKVTVWTNRARRVARWLHRSGILEGFPLDRKSDGEGGGWKKRNTFLPTHGKAELRRAANTCCSLRADCRSPVGPVSGMRGFHSTCFGQQRSREGEMETRLSDGQSQVRVTGLPLTGFTCVFDYDSLILHFTLSYWQWFAVLTMFKVVLLSLCLTQESTLCCTWLVRGYIPL